MTKAVYFDTNVFDHIHKKLGIKGADLRSLWSAVSTGRLCILLSIINLEEVLSALERDPTLALRELWLILKRADWRRLVKPPHQLLRDDIRCYARGDALLEPFIRDPLIQANLRMLEDPTQQDMDELLPILEEVRQQKEEYMARMRAKRKIWIKEMLPQVKEKQLQGKRSDFNRFWEVSAERFAEQLVEDPDDLHACQERGIRGLLEVRSVRLAVGANLSLIYSQTFEGRTPQPGDSRDMQHAVLAAAADMFATQDKAFAELLRRIPIEDFHVVDLRGLLEEVR